MIRSPLRSCFLAFLTTFLLTGASVFPQEAPSQWPTIPKDELALKDDPSNPGASAILLYRDVVSDDVKLLETQYYRIKVLTDAGRDYANVQIPYRQKSYRIEGIVARTVEPDGAIVDFDGQIYDKLIVKSAKVSFQAKTFTLPAVRAGSIIEYKYTMRFSGSFPGVLKNPESYSVSEPGAVMTARWVISDELFTRHAHFSLRHLPKASVLWAYRGLPDGKKPVANPDGTVQLDVDNVPAVIKEAYAPPEDTVQSRVDFYYVIGAYDAETYWTDQAKNLAADYDEFIGKSKKIKEVVNALVAANDSDETKLRKLYARAQQIRNLDFEHSRTEKEERREDLRTNASAEDVLKHGHASGDEINLLFVAFARAAGFEAAPVMVANRDRTVFHKEIPDREQLGAMVVWAKAGSKEYYLDPATLYCPFDILPWAETGSYGIRLPWPEAMWLSRNRIKGNWLMASTPEPQSSTAAIERKAQLQLDRGGNLEGKMQVNFSGQEALERRLDNREADEAGRRKALEDEVKGWLPTGSKVEMRSAGKWNQAEGPLQAEFTVKIPDYGIPMAHRMIMPMSVFETNEANPFHDPKRSLPVWLTYPYQISDDVTIQLPNDLKIEALPASRVFKDWFASYETSCQEQRGVVHMQRNLLMKERLIGTDHYSEVRAFSFKWRIGDEDQIVLQVVSPTQAAKSN